MRYLLTWLGAVACVVTTAPSAMATGEIRGPLALRAQMLRLAEVDWHVRMAATPRCPRLASGIGITIDHAAAYRPPDNAVTARVLRLGTLPQIAAVVPASPASQAGLRAGDELLAIGMVPMARMLAQIPERAVFAEDVMDHIAALPAGHPVTLVVQRGRTSMRKTVVPMAICASRTILETRSSLDAHSDANDIALTSALVDFTVNDDELALIVGHEFAHVILRPDLASPSAESPDLEREADLLGAAIAHCAGYDIPRAVAFWPRFDAQDALRQERLSTHPSPGQRETLIRNAVPDIACPIVAPPNAAY